MPARRVLRRAWASLACGVAFGAASASAAPKLQGIAETSLGYTDNFRTTPNSAALSGAPRVRGAFLMASPSLVLALDSVRALQRLKYRFEYNLFFAEPDTSSSSNQLEYQGFFDLSRRTSLLLGASVIESNRYASVAFAAPGSGAVGALPAGAGAFLQGAASDTLNVDLGDAWRFWQGENVLATTPILGTDAPRTNELMARSGVEKSFFRDAAGVEARSDYTMVTNAVRADGSRVGVQPQLVAGGVALWRHDWGRAFTSSAEAGASRVQRFSTGRGFWSPTASALLGYANPVGDAQLSYAHTISTNALLGQSLLADELRVRGSLPLTAHGELLLAATAGYQTGRLIDENAQLAAHVRVLLADVALGFQATRGLLFALRYQHIEQVSDARVPPLPLSFVQNNVLLGAILKFPPDRDMPTPYRAPRRVDRSDELRDGVPAASELRQQTEIPSK